MKRSLLLGVSFLLVVASAALSAARPAQGGPVAVIRVEAPLNPLTAQFIDSRIAAAARDGVSLIVLADSSREGYSDSVEAVAARIASSRIPVVVRPPHAGAPGEGAAGYLERAGAAFVEPGAAARLVSAGSLEGLVRSLDGETVLFQGRRLVLHTAGVEIRTFEMNGVARLLAELLDPTLAYVLLVVGLLGIAVEMSLPGVGLPGILGGLSLLISLVALGAFSVNLGGLLLILLALGLFVVDIKAPTHGVLTAGGLVALLAGSFLLFPGRAAPPGLEPLRISPLAIGVMTALLASVLVSAVVLGARTQRRRVQVGRETLVGKSGIALTDLNPSGTVRVANEEWSAVAVGEEVKAGEEVDVVEVEGVHLVIMRRL